MLNKQFLVSLGLFVLLNISLYLFISLFQARIPFQSFNYTYNAHHYLPDRRITGGNFDFLRGLGQYDAQWYLRIAGDGYPYKPAIVDLTNKNVVGGLSYAFFPLYPLALSGLNVFLNNLEVSAFLLANAFLIGNFLSLYFVVSKLFSTKIAIKTAFLLFFFPFSIFFRSYFSESLVLFFLIWFTYFLVRRRWFWSGLLLGLVSVTHPSGLALFPVYFYFLLKGSSKKKLFSRQTFLTVVLILVPMSLWLGFNFVQAGTPFFFLQIRYAWSDVPIVLFALNNFAKLVIAPILAVHSFHSSQIDILIIVVVSYLIIKSRGNLRPELWAISLALWLFPLLTTDTMSFPRHQINSFPLFIFLSQKLSSWRYGLLLAVFIAGLFMVSLYFVNWYWIG